MDEAKKTELNTAERFTKTTLNNTLKEIMAGLNAECGSLFLFDPKNQELVLEAFCNSKNVSISGLKYRMGEGITGKVANISAPVIVRNLDEDLRFKRNGYTHYRSKSFISIPLLSSKGLLGLINLTDKTSGQPFEEKDLKYALSITKYACMAIDVFNDAMEIRQQKEALDKQKVALEKYATVGKLAAGIVHEINNPLDGIIRYTNILLRQLEENTIAREYLLEAKTGLDRIANITRSLLEFSHVVNSHSSYVQRYIDLHALIDESIKILSEKLNGNIQIQKKYRPSLPKILDLGLQHVVINIVKNAIDAMPQGGTLEVTTDIDDSMVRIGFRDTGVGIPDELKERVFEPFFTTKGMNKGTGLGLAMCKEIINKYEGAIKLDSALNKGSNFMVLIPAKYIENA